MLSPVPHRLAVATDPPEARGLARDHVRLLVSRRSDGQVWHAAFRDLPDLLDPGDVLVVNESGTLAASLESELAGVPVRLHLSTELPGGVWVAEVRRILDGGTVPFGAGLWPRARLDLPAGGEAVLLRRHARGARLWHVRLTLPATAREYLALHGGPIRYAPGRREWPMRHYQTVFGRVPGSAEMPSAGRPFTLELLARLRERGVGIAPLVLHTGVSSLEDHEPPFAEWYRVPEATARAANRARAADRRVLAVGTTAVRALEAATSTRGIVRAGQGWTDLVITPERGLHAPLAVLTGLHEPRSSHLALLGAVAGEERVAGREAARSVLIARSYAAAVERGYLWHEFGDLHLIL